MKKFLLALLFPLNSVFAQSISIDIGHHLKDPGATSAYGITEYTYNKRLGDSVKKQLEANGNKVKIINESGSAISLYERANLAKGSNFLVSLHHDSVPEKNLKYWQYQGRKHHFNDKTKGFSIFVSTKNPYFNKSLLCANQISDNLIKEGFPSNYRKNATLVSNNGLLFFKNKPIYKYDNLAVLRTSSTPAILIEAGVIVNRREAIWIAQEHIRERFANAVTIGINQCMVNKKGNIKPNIIGHNAKKVEVTTQNNSKWIFIKNKN